jgi:hypothetical protein
MLPCIVFIVFKTNINKILDNYKKKKKIMAKSKSAGESRKISFGKKVTGKAFKLKGPKDAPQKKRYRGQGR